MPQDLTDDKSTLVQVMAWCRQATSHYMKQCWLRSPTPYGVTRPQWSDHLLTIVVHYVHCIIVFELQFTSCNIMLAFEFCHIRVSNVVCYFISFYFSYYFWLNRNDINHSPDCCCPVKLLNICPTVWDLTYTKANLGQRASFVWDPCQVNGRSQS